MKKQSFQYPNTVAVSYTANNQPQTNMPECLVSNRDTGAAPGEDLTDLATWRSGVADEKANSTKEPALSTSCNTFSNVIVAHQGKGEGEEEGE